MVPGIRITIALFLVASSAQPLAAQKGYEFEIYDTRINRVGAWTAELHTNFVTSAAASDGTGPVTVNKALRSALEIGTGLTSWLEASIYSVGYARSGRGVQYVGNRARVTVVSPRSSSWPLRFGLSQEIGYARDGFAEDKWAYEVSPIVEARLGRMSVVANPALERGIGGKEKHRVELEPRLRGSYRLNGETAISLEYYGGIGPVLKAEPVAEQHHQLFAAFETELAERWEIGLGIGRGFTSSSDRGVIATKLEYSWTK